MDPAGGRPAARRPPRAVCERCRPLRHPRRRGAVVPHPRAVAAPDVLAFGDMPNDVEMLRGAGHGAAMGNAHPAVEAVADEVTAPHTEDGVAVVLERWF